MKFQYFTFFLNPVAVLFEDERNKIDILEEILTTENPILYKHHGSQLAYVFKQRSDSFIFARIGRKSLIKKILSPNRQFEETREENWPYCDVVFNLSTNPEKGQKIAFEYDSSVFSSPYEQLKNLADEINNQLMIFGYAIAINPITKEQIFWNLIEENNGKIERLSLSFNAPNLFGLRNTFNAEMKDAQDKYNLNKATIEFENSDGQLSIPRDDELIKEGVEYITRGGGEYSIKIKGRTRRVISSKDNIQTKSFDFEGLEVTTTNPELLELIVNKIFE